MRRLAGVFVAASVALGLFAIGPARTQSIPAPPLLPGEAIYTTSGGCAMIFHQPANQTPEQRESTRDYWAKSTWRGPCRYGLAHGAGNLHGPEYVNNGWVQSANGSVMPYTYFYGRILGKVVAGGEYPSISYFSLDGRAANRDPGDPLTPRWSDTYAAQSHISADGWSASTYSTTCYADTARFANCTGDGYKVYGMWIYRPGETQGTPPTIWCPNPTTTAGCEALWREQSGPVYAAYQAIQAEVERNYPAWQQQLMQLNAPREAQLAAIENARKAEEARQLAEAAAAADRADKAFKAKLATGNAGQLFALADELRAEGDTDKARQVLRALVSRFPDHPLSANAANQLSQMGSSTSPSSPGHSAAASPATSYGAAPSAATPAATPAAGVSEAACKAEGDRLAAVLQASNARTANNVVYQMESLMYVLTTMADASDRICPRTREYTDAAAAFRQKAREVRQTCAAMSSTGDCSATLH
jgi:hypothetical protein